jgi:tripartite motif-containing protein 2/3
MCLKFIKSNGIITSTKNNQTFLINKQFTCISRNVIYVITCTKCNIQYVGETNQTLRDRLNNHLSNIKTKKITPIANHFNTTEHKISDLVIQPVDEPPENNEETRRKLERLWMKRLETIHPHGLNFIPAFKNKHLYNK